MLRTFSKAWALAAFRVGYVVGDPTAVRAVDATLTPFSVSAPAQAAALAALEQSEEVARRAAIVVAERDRVSQTLRGRGRPLPDSQGNFVWLPTGEASAALADAMERRGVVTRPFPSGHPGDARPARTTTTASSTRSLAALGRASGGRPRPGVEAGADMTTWVPVPEGSDFPVENLPFGIVRPRRELPRPAVRIGDHVVDLAALSRPACSRCRRPPCCTTPRSTR